MHISVRPESHENRWNRESLQWNCLTLTLVTNYSKVEEIMRWQSKRNYHLTSWESGNLNFSHRYAVGCDIESRTGSYPRADVHLLRQEPITRHILNVSVLCYYLYLHKFKISWLVLGILIHRSGRRKCVWCSYYRPKYPRAYKYNTFNTFFLKTMYIFNQG